MPDRNSDVDDERRLRADICVSMWEHSQICTDGYDPLRSRKDRIEARARIHRRIDADLDRWAMTRFLTAIANLGSDL